MEEHIALIILEHRCHQFDVHVLNIDFLEGGVEHENSFVKFFDVGYDSREEAVAC